MTNLVVIQEDQLERQIRKAVREEVKTSLSEHDRERNGDRLYTINQVAKRLFKSHSTIKKYCAQGFIQTTKSGLIPESAIEKYLQGT